MSELACDRIALLELDVDCRVADLWALAQEVEEWTLEQGAKFLRAAFVAGYMEAARGDLSLFLDNGYEVPRGR